MTKTFSIPVEDFSSPSAIHVSPNSDVQGIRKEMQTQKIRHILVKEKESIIGLISDRDLRFLDFLEAQELKLNQKITAIEIMQKEPYTVAASTPLEEVAINMSKHKIGSAVISYPSGSFGIFTSTDALNALIEVLRGELN